MQKTIKPLLSCLLVCSLLVSIICVSIIGVSSTGTTRLLGDVDKSGDISVDDATRTQLGIGKVITLDETESYLANVDGEDILDVRDVTYIQMYLAKLITNLAVNADGYKIGDEVVITDVQKEFTVVFKDYDGTVLKTETVTGGSRATAPTIPQREGYIFSGWDKKFDRITENLVITAQYVATYTVTFKNYDGTVISSQNIPEGGIADLPATPTKSGETFLGWSGVYTDVDKNETIEAVYSDDKNVFIVESVSCGLNETVNVLVSVDGDVKTCGFDFTLLYDSGLELVSYDSDLDLDIVANENAVENGVVLNFSSASDKKKQRDIIELTFKIKDSTKVVFPVTIDVRSVKEVSGSNILNADYSVVNGLVKKK